MRCGRRAGTLGGMDGGWAGVGPGQSGAGEDGAEESLPTRKYMYLAEPSCLVSVYSRNPRTLYVCLSLRASDHLHRYKLLDYLGIYCFNCCCSTWTSMQRSGWYTFVTREFSCDGISYFSFWF